jgi:hypothetical protein
VASLQGNNDPVEVLESCLLTLSKTKSEITQAQNHLRRIIAQLKVKESKVQVQDHLANFSTEKLMDDPMMRELREMVTNAIETE